MKKRMFALLLALVLALSLLPAPIAAEGAPANTLTAYYINKNGVNLDYPMTKLSLVNNKGYRFAFYYNGDPVPYDRLQINGQCIGKEADDENSNYVQIRTNAFGGAQIKYTPQGGSEVSMDVDVCVGFSSGTTTENAIREWAYDGTDKTDTIYLLASSGFYFDYAKKEDNNGNSALFTLTTVDGEAVNGQISGTGCTCLKLTLNDELLETYPDHRIGVDTHFRNSNNDNDGYLFEIDITNNAPHLAVRYLSWNDSEQTYFEDTGRNLLDSISGVRGYRDSLIFYYVTKDGQSTIRVDELRVSGPLSLEHEDDGNTNNSRYARLRYTGFGSGTVSYTPQDGQTVSLPVSVSLPTFGFYTDNERSEENFTTEWNLREQSTLYIFLEEGWKFASDQYNAGLSIRGDTPDGITLDWTEGGSAATISVDPARIDALQNSDTRRIELHYEIADEHGGGQGSNIRLELNYDKSISWQDEPTAGGSISYDKDYTLTEEIARQGPNSLDGQLYWMGSDESVGAFEFDSDSDGTPETYYVSLGRYFTKPDGEVYLELCQNSGTTISEKQVRRGEYAAGVFTAIMENGPDGPQRTYIEASPEIYRALADEGYHFTVTVYRTDRCGKSPFPQFSAETDTPSSGRPCPFSLRFGAENTGYWIMAARLLDSQGVQVAMGHGSEEIFSTKDVVYNLTSEIGTMDELNDFIADRLKQQDHARVFFNLPQGISYEGILRIPFTYGLNDCTPIISGNDTTITGGVIVGNEGKDDDDTRYLAERCSFYAVDFNNISFVGAGKDSNTPNNYGISGPGRATYSNCSFTGYDHAIHSDLNFTFGGQDSTFANNNVGIYLDCQLDNGGNWEIRNCTFKHNVSAMELIRFPGGSLNPVSVQNTKFLNNGIDVNNRTTRFLDFSFNYFYHGPESDELSYNNYPQHSKRLIPIFYGLWQSSADIPATLAWPLATTPACDTFFCPGYQTMQEAYNGKLNNTDVAEDASQTFFLAFTQDTKHSYAKELFGKRDTAWVSMDTASQDACRISVSELEGQIISYVDENSGKVGTLTVSPKSKAPEENLLPARSNRLFSAAPLRSGAGNDGSFDPSFEKQVNDGEIVLRFPSGNNYSDYDIRFSLSCPYAAAEVWHGNEIVASVYENGTVSFPLTDGGEYSIRDNTLHYLACYDQDGKLLTALFVELNEHGKPIVKLSLIPANCSSKKLFTLDGATFVPVKAAGEVQ